MAVMGDHGVQKVCPNLGCGTVLVHTEQSKAPAAESVPAQSSKPSRKAPETFDVIKEAKRRKRWISAEVKRLRKELRAAEKEEGQLARLLKAADEKPTATVRPITSVAR